MGFEVVSRWPVPAPLLLPLSGSSAAPLCIPAVIRPRGRNYRRTAAVRCGEDPVRVLRTCKNCKAQFDPALNHPQACRFHTAHFGGETRRKFESVYEGGTLNTPDSGKVFQYWHCCGSEDPFDAGCTASPHSTYD